MTGARQCPGAGGFGDVFTVLPVEGRPTPPPSGDGTRPAPIPGGFVVRPQGHPDGHRAPPIATGATQHAAEAEARRFHARRVDRSQPGIYRVDFEHAREFTDLETAARWAWRAQDGVDGAPKRYLDASEHAEIMRVTNMSRDAKAEEAAEAARRAAASKAEAAASAAADHLRQLELEAKAAAAAVVVPDGLRILTPEAKAAA